jgi:hypothetical protein
VRAKARVPAFFAIAIVVATLFVTVVASVPAAGAGQPVGAGQQGVSTNGFFLLGGDGGVFPFGVPFAGSAAADPATCAPNLVDRTEPNGTCWSMAVTPSGMGYWILNGDTGFVHAFGTAGSYGEPSAGFAGVSREFVPNFRQIVPTPSGKGYWVYEVGASDLGTIAHFGDAAFFGDTIGLAAKAGASFNGSAVGMAPTADGKGYWEVHSDGGVFAFGDAKFYGSTGAMHLTRPIIGITATADGKGYWLYAADGGVFAFGDAVFAGSTGGLSLVAPVVGMARNPAGPGYWLAAADGGVFAFGGAPYLGSIAQFGVRLQRPIFAIAAKSASLT